MIYNRLYINYRELKSPECRRKAWDCLDESKKWAEQLEESALKDEFTYLNHKRKIIIYLGTMQKISTRKAPQEGDELLSEIYSVSFALSEARQSIFLPFGC